MSELGLKPSYGHRYHRWVLDDEHVERCEVCGKSQDELRHVKARSDSAAVVGRPGGQHVSTAVERDLLHELEVERAAFGEYVEALQRQLDACQGKP